MANTLKIMFTLLTIVTLSSFSQSAVYYQDQWWHENPHNFADEPFPAVIHPGPETPAGKVFYQDQWWHENPHNFDDEPFPAAVHVNNMVCEKSEVVGYQDEWWHENPHNFAD